MNSLRTILVMLICVVFVVGVSFVAHAAQSTTDIMASNELKEKARKTVLGKDAGKSSDTSGYIIGAGDFLEVELYGEGSMAVSAPTPSAGTLGIEPSPDMVRAGGAGVQVRIDGRVSLKHIGEVEVVGMTLTQMADYLKILYKTVYEDPIVTVVLNKSNSKRYTVMGKVLSPGVYYIDYPINLVQTIARSGGFTEWANSKMTVVRENTEKQTRLFEGNTLKFDYDEFLKGKDLKRNIQVEPDDIIIVH
ncbi:MULTISPECIES: polysaccharide biosynthesis/export family protein [Desulfosediminicola]|uniref:polysaccharide biosynthesis/export family protein n=1 Tax=Desulfosediminicola TaxID=2886823 RepID=UPI00142EFD01|nr:polysaccharide biosynthesis/export family protein [Desulfosediminicola ganghwensis]